MIQTFPFISFLCGSIFSSNILLPILKIDMSHFSYLNLT